MPDFSSITTAQWLIAILAAFLTGMSKAGFGGVGMLVVLLMAVVFPARQSTGIILPILIFADIFAVLIYRKHAVLSHIWRLMPPALVGIVCGFWLMPHIPGELFGRVIGWTTLALTLLYFVQKASGGLEKIAISHPAIALPTGWLAGVTTMLANSAGPIMIIYLLACRLPKFAFVGTGAWYFFFVNIVKIPFSAQLGLIDRSSLLFNVCLAPAVIVGIFVARYFLGKIPQVAFENLMAGMTVAASIYLIFL